MPVAVVYENVGSGGSLFKGKTFYISQRIPQREHFINLVKANGGDVIRLDKLADIVIADHARKDAPIGSYSWTYIEKSLKDGELADLEQHRAGAAAGATRAVGSSVPTKKSRTPFTAADDRILTDWVLNSERQGGRAKGNLIYEDLERLHPHHTFQSWRDRWVKSVESRARSKPLDFKESGPSVVDSPVKQRNTTPVPKGSHTTTTNSMKSSSKVVASFSQTRQISPSATSPDQQPVSTFMTETVSTKKTSKSLSADFTDEEFVALFKFYRDIQKIDVSLETSAWTAWAKEQPQHTADQWRHFWLNVVKPFGESNIAAANEVEPVMDDSVMDASTGQSKAPQILSDAEHITVPASPLFVPRGLETRDHPKMSSKRRQQKSRFTTDLLVFAEKQALEVNLYPTICGRQISLFDLWLVVHQREYGGFNKVDASHKWPQIAHTLGFDQVHEQNAADALKRTYDEMLLDFAEARAKFRKEIKASIEAGEPVDEEEWEGYEILAMIESPSPSSSPAAGEFIDLERETSYYFGGEVPSSLPQRGHVEPSIIPLSLSGSKTLLPKHNSHKSSQESPSTFSTPNKRQKIDKGKAREVEIPSTPDNLIGLAVGKVTPLALSPLGQVSQEQEVNAGEHEEAGEEAVEGFSLNHLSHTISRKLFRQVSQQPKTRTHLEPETQKFHYSNTIHNDKPTLFHPKLQRIQFLGVHNMNLEDRVLQEVSFTQSRRDSELHLRELREYKDHWISLGYSERIVSAALAATTLHTGDAPTVMEALQQGLPIPDNMQGVWTALEDKVVRSGDAANQEDVDILMQKHGLDRLLQRQHYLRDVDKVLEEEVPD